MKCSLYTRQLLLRSFQSPLHITFQIIDVARTINVNEKCCLNPCELEFLSINHHLSTSIKNRSYYNVKMYTELMSMDLNPALLIQSYFLCGMKSDSDPSSSWLRTHLFIESPFQLMPWIPCLGCIVIAPSFEPLLFLGAIGLLSSWALRCFLLPGVQILSNQRLKLAHWLASSLNQSCLLPSQCVSGLKMQRKWQVFLSTFLLKNGEIWI